MSEPLENKLLKTADGSFTVHNVFYSEAYHSKGGALTEAKSLYIEGSALNEALECSYEEKKN